MVGGSSELGDFEPKYIKQLPLNFLRGEGFT